MTADPHPSRPTASPPSPTRGEGTARATEGKERKPRKVRPKVAVARKLRVNATDAERRLWLKLRQPPFDVHKFRRQTPLGPYIADFLSHPARLVVEADGGQHAGNADDQRRDAWFAKQGFRVIRFRNVDILANTDGVMATLARALDNRSQEFKR